MSEGIFFGAFGVLASLTLGQTDAVVGLMAGVLTFAYLATRIAKANARDT